MMERNYGKQSYHPKNLALVFWGNGTNRYEHVCDSKISQNILFACYNDKLSAEQISLEIGVALPYMEDKLAELCEYGLLKKEGNRYITNLVIFTKDLAMEVTAKTAKLREKIADLLVEAVAQKEAAIRSLGFRGADMSQNSFAWQTVSLLLYQAVIETLQGRVKPAYPTDKFGTACFIWGVETGEQAIWESKFGFGISRCANSLGDFVQFMDFPINGEIVYHYYSGRQNAVNVLLDIAKGNATHFSENDRAVAADMVRMGYLTADGEGFAVNMPVFTGKQYAALKEILSDVSAKIAEEAENVMETVTEILKNHIPVHLKKLARDMAYFRLFEDAISAPVSLLYERKELLPYSGNGMHPTTYLVLNP